MPRKKSINYTLYEDTRPGRKKIKGTGFKDAKTARKTIKILKESGASKRRQIWTINTMYYRAKHHPHRTKGMIEAMIVFRKWLDKNVGKK
jgi:hypothetical protein